MPAIVPPATKVYSFSQLEQLWIAAGGPGAVAVIAAAIAEAESGGRANATNPTDNNGTQTSWGLWQISNGTHNQPVPNILDPLTNARQAVAKYKASGWNPWGTFTSGAYKKYLPAGSSSPGDHGGTAIVAEAKKFLGVPYVWGGESPKGFDCSGLVQYALTQLGFKNVPRTSEEQWKWVQHITKAQLQPGDLVFYQGSEAGASAANPGHVAIYAGNNQIIQAPQTGMDVQQIPMPAGATGYGRIPGVGQAVITPASGSGSGGSGGSDDGGASWLSAIWDGIKGGWDFSAGIPGDVAGAANAAVSTADAVKGLTAPFVTIAHAVDWFINPNHWVRIGCLFFGSALTLMGIVTMTRTGRSYSISNPLAGASYEGASLPSTLPAPGGQLAPAVGIAEVTVGAILLFVAFHNLPTSVDSFGGFIGHLTSELQSGGTSG